MGTTHHLIIAVVAFVVLCFSIAATADYWYRQNSVVSERNSKLGLWRLKAEDNANGIVLAGYPRKLTKDIWACRQPYDYLKTIAAFCILTCIFSLVTIGAAAAGIAGATKAPLGLICAAVTAIFDLIAWAMGAGFYHKKFCKDEYAAMVPPQSPFQLSQGVPNGSPVEKWKYYNGFYFMLVPWCFLVLGIIAAAVLGAGDSGDEAPAKKEEKAEAKEDAVQKNKEANPLEPKKEDESPKPKDEEESPKPVEEKKEEPKPEEEKKEEEPAAAAPVEEKKEEEPAAAAPVEKKEEPKPAEEENDEEEQIDDETARRLNEEDVERRRKIWHELKDRLPVDRKDAAQRRRRFELFAEFDTDGKKFLTPQDLDHGCKHVLGLGQLKKGLAHILPKAHANARAANQRKGRNKVTSDENVERCEFRLVFVNIRDLFDLWFMFDTLDVASTGAISYDEFVKGIPTLQEWGKTIDDPEAEFKVVDAAGTGKISFNEFCDWAKANDLEDDGDETDNDAVAEEESEDDRVRRNKEDVERRRKIWADLAPRLPTNKQSKEERLRRFAYFREFDTTGKGYITLADVEEGCATVLGLGQLGKGLKHLLPLAYNSARGKANVRGQDTSAMSEEHVQKSEVRLLFVYIHQFFDLWFLFDTLDVANSGHISFDEFKEGMHEIESWAGVKIEDPEAEFKAADTANSGEIIFLEFCEWAKQKNTSEV